MYNLQNAHPNFPKKNWIYWSAKFRVGKMTRFAWFFLLQISRYVWSKSNKTQFYTAILVFGQEINWFPILGPLNNAVYVPQRNEPHACFVQVPPHHWVELLSWFEAQTSGHKTAMWTTTMVKLLSIDIAAHVSLGCSWCCTEAFKGLAENLTSKVRRSPLPWKI